MTQKQIQLISRSISWSQIGFAEKLIRKNDL